MDRALALAIREQFPGEWWAEIAEEHFIDCVRETFGVVGNFLHYGGFFQRYPFISGLEREYYLNLDKTDDNYPIYLRHGKVKFGKNETNKRRTKGEELLIERLSIAESEFTIINSYQPFFLELVMRCAAFPMAISKK